MDDIFFIEMYTVVILLIIGWKRYFKRFQWFIELNVTIASFFLIFNTGDLALTINSTILLLSMIIIIIRTEKKIKKKKNDLNKNGE